MTPNPDVARQRYSCFEGMTPKDFLALFDGGDSNHPEADADLPIDVGQGKEDDGTEMDDVDADLDESAADTTVSDPI